MIVLKDQVLAILTSEGLTWKELQRRLDRHPGNIYKALRSLEISGKVERCAIARPSTRRNISLNHMPRMVWRRKA
jgi:predicted transcriptional regulator